MAVEKADDSLGGARCASEWFAARYVAADVADDATEGGDESRDAEATCTVLTVSGMFCFDPAASILETIEA